MSEAGVIETGPVSSAPAAYVDRVVSLAETLCKVDPRIRIAKNEEDGSTGPCKEAARFLKLDEQRFGRDLELYGLLAKIEGEQWATTMLLEELVLPLKARAFDAMKAGCEHLRTFQVFAENQRAWDDMMVEFISGE